MCIPFTIWSAITLHDLVPYWPTSPLIALSSSIVHTLLELNKCKSQQASMSKQMHAELFQTITQTKWFSKYANKWSCTCRCPCPCSRLLRWCPSWVRETVSEWERAVCGGDRRYLSAAIAAGFCLLLACFFLFFYIFLKIAEIFCRRF